MPGPQVASVTVSVSSATAISTASGWLPMDQYNVPFNVGFGCHKHGGGDVTFRVEHTFDDVFDPDVASARSFTHADVTAATGNVDGNYAYAVAAIRVATVSASGSARVELIVRQAGI